MLTFLSMDLWGTRSLLTMRKTVIQRKIRMNAIDKTIVSVSGKWQPPALTPVLPATNFVHLIVSRRNQYQRIRPCKSQVRRLT